MSTPLPEPVLSQKYHHDPRYDIAYYTADQLKSYGAAEYKRALDDAAEYLQQASAHEEDSTELAFEAWWLSDGQFCRAGGGDYEKTFAWRAWEASLAIPVQAQPVPSSKYPCKLTDAELADPEYMRSYIEAMNQDYADLLYAQLVQAPEPEGRRKEQSSQEARWAFDAALPAQDPVVNQLPVLDSQNQSNEPVS